MSMKIWKDMREARFHRCSNSNSQKEDSLSFSHNAQLRWSSRYFNARERSTRTQAPLFVLYSSSSYNSREIFFPAMLTGELDGIFFLSFLDQKDSHGQQ